MTQASSCELSHYSLSSALTTFHFKIMVAQYSTVQSELKRFADNCRSGKKSQDLSRDNLLRLIGPDSDRLDWGPSNFYREYDDKQLKCHSKVEHCATKADVIPSTHIGR